MYFKRFLEFKTNNSDNSLIIFNNKDNLNKQYPTRKCQDFTIHFKYPRIRIIRVWILII